MNRKTFILIERHQWSNIIHTEYIALAKDFRERLCERPKESWIQCVQCEVRARFDCTSRMCDVCVLVCKYLYVCVCVCAGAYACFCCTHQHHMCVCVSLFVDVSMNKNTETYLSLLSSPVLLLRVKYSFTGYKMHKMIQQASIAHAMFMLTTA